ncbi:GNAT family N-acetyltransferase [Actinomycetospora sp. NBRC 106378]|uniref:GNAT family N-acetyltransferase n=1 Tax=Actinomycetospora sp. NBRC 106378 TaxID=3032208 RepID=UPI0024A135FA|nr:GNAT family N-acetyltransferase [Actinomycetospora sp. NBRC 106378]GLZ54891.1 N-acetyltransferase [Actinomycetospora sp. NBRC 106378]
MLVTTTYLEQTSPDRLRPAAAPADPLDVVRAEEPSPEFSRFLDTAVGGPWHWTDKLGFTWNDWYAHVTQEGRETWVAHHRGTPAGYAELQARPTEGGSEVEIESFGLLPHAIGRGFGGHLLTRALTEAWRLDTRWPDLAPVRRVWLHTCTLDGPHARRNYERRGLVAYDTRTHQQDDVPAPGPWPGSHADSAASSRDQT